MPEMRTHGRGEHGAGGSRPEFPLAIEQGGQTPTALENCAQPRSSRTCCRARVSLLGLTGWTKPAAARSEPGDGAWQRTHRLLPAPVGQSSAKRPGDGVLHPEFREGLYLFISISYLTAAADAYTHQDTEETESRPAQKMCPRSPFLRLQLQKIPRSLQHRRKAFLQDVSSALRMLRTAVPGLFWQARSHLARLRGWLLLGKALAAAAGSIGATSAGIPSAPVIYMAVFITSLLQRLVQ